MDDQRFDTNDPIDPEIEWRLEAYADLRLSPSVAATTRMRAAVMAAAHRRAALMEADAASGTAGALTVATDTTVIGLAARQARSTRHPWRRPIAAVIAASLTLGVLAGTVVGARPGGPFYAVRLWAEMTNLPKDVLARAQAEVARLDARLQEASQASRDGDGPATEASLEAYSAILEEASIGTGGDPAATAAIENGLARHVEVLTGLAGQVPAAAREAIQHALSSSTKVLDGLGQPGSSGGDDQGGSGANGQPGGLGDPGVPGPDKTPKPKPSGNDKSPQPAKTTGPEPGGPRATPDHPVPSRRP